MTTSRASRPTERSNADKCQHPRVRIVAREEDVEFVECLECGDVFDSSEFKDMDIEERKPKET
jgi:Zn ribbon nucleic-acid-binding protein